MEKTQEQRRAEIGLSHKGLDLSEPSQMTWEETLKLDRKIMGEIYPPNTSKV